MGDLPKLYPQARRMARRLEARSKSRSRNCNPSTGEMVKERSFPQWWFCALKKEPDFSAAKICEFLQWRWLFVSDLVFVRFLKDIPFEELQYVRFNMANNPPAIATLACRGHSAWRGGSPWRVDSIPTIERLLQMQIAEDDACVISRAG